ncbi:LysR family transcriptional regulator [Arthrobacter sp. UYEF3]|uniref:LysR family transcriptional regulator n=1 Tax=Arthrobacter sp. UYEF3 TaxID=1756365 RepID=UPI003392A3B8
MSYTIDQLRAFVVVAEEMHFGRAAERLNISQPPLSRQIQSLERHLHVQLFDRSRRAITLTTAGAGYLSDIRRSLELLEASEVNVRRASDGLRGSVHLGFTLIVGNIFVPQLLKLAAEELPGVKLVLHEMNTARQPSALQEGTIDLGMSRPVPGLLELHSKRLPSDTLLAAVPKNFGLCRNYASSGASGLPILPVAALDGQDFVMYAENGPAYFYDLLRSIFTLWKVTPLTVQEIVEVYTMLQLVDSGIGVALIPSSARRWVGENTQLFRMPELEPHTIDSTLIWNKASRNPALKRVLELTDRLEFSSEL